MTNDEILFAVGKFAGTMAQSHEPGRNRAFLPAPCLGKDEPDEDNFDWRLHSLQQLVKTTNEGMDTKGQSLRDLLDQYLEPAAADRLLALSVNDFWFWKLLVLVCDAARRRDGGLPVRLEDLEAVRKQLRNSGPMPDADLEEMDLVAFSECLQQGTVIAHYAKVNGRIRVKEVAPNPIFERRLGS